MNQDRKKTLSKPDSAPARPSRSVPGAMAAGLGLIMALDAALGVRGPAAELVNLCFLVFANAQTWGLAVFIPGAAFLLVRALLRGRGGTAPKPRPRPKPAKAEAAGMSLGTRLKSALRRFGYIYIVLILIIGTLHLITEPGLGDPGFWTITAVVVCWRAYAAGLKYRLHALAARVGALAPVRLALGLGLFWLAACLVMVSLICYMLNPGFFLAGLALALAVDFLVCSLFRFEPLKVRVWAAGAATVLFVAAAAATNSGYALYFFGFSAAHLALRPLGLSLAAGAGRGRSGRPGPGLLQVLGVFCLIGVFAFGQHKFVHLGGLDTIRSRPGVTFISGPARHIPMLIGEGPYDLTSDPSGRYLFVTYGVMQAVARIDLEQPSRIRFIETGDRTRPERLMFNPHLSEVYVENSDEGSDISLLVFGADPFELKAVVRDQRQLTPVYLELDRGRAPGRLFVLHQSFRSPWISTYGLDGPAPRLDWSGRLPWRQRDVYALVLDPDRERIYVASWGMGRELLEIDARSLRALRSRYLGPTAMGMAVDSEAGRLYVARPLHSRIDVLDIETLASAGRLPAGFGARDIALDRDRQLLFSANSLHGTVDVISIRDRRRLTTYRVGHAAKGLHYREADRRLFAVSELGVFELDVSGF